jgi:hypothetical protein
MHLLLYLQLEFRILCLMYQCRLPVAFGNQAFGAVDSTKCQARNHSCKDDVLSQPFLVLHLASLFRTMTILGQFGTSPTCGNVIE